MKTLLLLLFLSVSCGSVNTTEMSSGVGAINAHTVSIDAVVDDAIQSNDPSSLPSIKNHTKEIRAEGDKIKEREKDLLEEIADLKDTSFFRKAVPWIPVALGVACLIFGYMTKDIEDTIAGVVLCICGVVLNQYWAFIGLSGLIIMILFGLGWFIVSHDWKKVKKRLE